MSLSLVPRDWNDRLHDREPTSKSFADASKVFVSDIETDVQISI